MAAMLGSGPVSVPKLAPKVISKAERYPHTARARESGKYVKFATLKHNLFKK